MYVVSRSQQLAILGVYLAIVLAGSVCSKWSWLGSEGSHYFATRNNILNQWFVKQGWFWFTVVYWASYFGRLYRSTPPRAILHYFAATGWWILFSQRFFGAPIMDRIFMLSGGECVLEHLPKLEMDTAQAVAPGTSLVCRRTGGLWLGGHDPSGHVFLLVQSSVVLIMETLPAAIEYSRRGLRLGWPFGLPLALLALWAFMLFMTSVYFHSFWEKLTGLLFAAVEVLLVYRYSEQAKEQVAETEDK